MKRILAVLAALMALVVAGAAWADVPKKAQKGVELIKERLQGRGEIRDVYEDPETGFVVVKVMLKQGNTLFPLAAYVTPDGKYVLFGSIFEAETKKDLTREVHLAGLTPERVKIDPKPWIKEPFLGKGEETLLLVAGPKCPHCRNLVPKLIDEVKENGKVRLAYVTFSPFSPPETEKALECVRSKRPELFWDAVKQAYTAPPEELPLWLKEKDFDYQKECPGLVMKQDLPPVDGVPSVIAQDGRVLGGEYEIMDYLKRGSQS